MDRLRRFMILLASIGLMMVFVMDVNAVEESLLLHYSFEEKAAVDLSGKGNDGKIIGTVDYIEGPIGVALQLDGSSGYVEIEPAPELLFSGNASFTVECWFQTEHVADTNYAFITTYGPEKIGPPYWLLFVHGSNHVRWGVNDGEPSIAEYETPLSDGKWHHLAGVRDKARSVLQLYVDGKLEIEAKDETTEALHQDQGIWLGNHLNRFWKVALDEVKIWDKALTAEEVRRSMQGLDLLVEALRRLPVTLGYLKTQE